MSNDGAVFYVKPLPDATTSPWEFDRDGLGRFSMGLTSADDTYAKTLDGEYEVRAYGPAQEQGVEMVARYYFWEITRRVSWTEWRGRRETSQYGYHSWSPEERAEYNAMYDR